MLRHVRRACGVTRSSGGVARRVVIRVAGGGVRGKCSGACDTASYLAARPGTRGFNRVARALVSRMLHLEVGKHVLRAIGGPDHQGTVALFGDAHFPESRFKRMGARIQPGNEVYKPGK